jgi:hypothetical protein
VWQSSSGSSSITLSISASETATPGDTQLYLQACSGRLPQRNVLLLFAAIYAARFMLKFSLRSKILSLRAALENMETSERRNAS